MKPPRRIRHRAEGAERWFTDADIPPILRQIIGGTCDEFSISRAGVKVQPLARYELNAPSEKVCLEMGVMEFVIWRMPGTIEPVAFPAPDGPGWYELDARTLDGADLGPAAYPITIDHVRVLIPGVNAVVSRTMN